MWTYLFDLLDLPGEAQDALAKGLISTGHAKVLLGLKKGRALTEVLAQIVRKELSVRDAEALVRSHAEPKASGGSSVSTAPSKAPAWVGELESRLRDALGAKVVLRNGPGYRGSITIEYPSRDELERLTAQIAPKAEL